MRAGATLVRTAAASVALLVASGLVSGLIASGSSRTPSRFEFAQSHMGTTARVVLYADTAATARALADRAFARIDEIDSRLSDYRPDSEVMVLCRAAGGPAMPVSDDLFSVLATAQRVFERSDGAFDVTIGPVSRLWRRARVTGELPDADSIAGARALVGYEHVHLSPPRSVRLAKRGMLLDLGGIAKGYAADQALAVLRAGGAPRALVALGGDVAAADSPPDKEGWTVAIAPLGPAVPTGLPPVILRHAAVSTSGDAEQYLEREGTRYSHVVVPRTGGALEGRRGVTVRARDGVTADALATAVSVLGRERGFAVIDATAGAAAILVESTPRGVREHRSHNW
jgi:FAD:protein FMN transferase